MFACSISCLKYLMMNKRLTLIFFSQASNQMAPKAASAFSFKKEFLGSRSVIPTQPSSDIPTPSQSLHKPQQRHQTFPMISNPSEIFSCLEKPPGAICGLSYFVVAKRHWSVV